MIRRILLYICIFILLSVATVFSWINFTYIKAEDLSHLKSGDIIFQTTNTGLTMPILLASSSLYTHVGIVKEYPDGRKTIIDAGQHVREVPLSAWISGGVFRRITVMRVKGLNPEQVQQVISSAEAYKGLPYDFFFLMSDDQIYCSELIYKAFLKAGLEIGEKEVVKDLSVANYAVQNYIEKWWYKHPLCIKRNIKGYNECLQVILNQELVTPVSLARDEQLELIYTNYGPKWFVQ